MATQTVSLEAARSLARLCGGGLWIMYKNWPRRAYAPWAIMTDAERMQADSNWITAERV